jgi:hypothetical protein
MGPGLATMRYGIGTLISYGTNVISAIDQQKVREGNPPMIVQLTNHNYGVYLFILVTCESQGNRTAT